MIAEIYIGYLQVMVFLVFFYVLLLSSIVEIITLSRLEREMLCVLLVLLTVSQVVLAPVYTYLMQH